MKSSRLIWAFIGCFASLSAHAQVTIIDAADYVAVMAETPEANEVSVGWGVTNLGGQTQYLMVTRTIEESVEPWGCPYSGEALGAYERFCWGPICYPFCSTSSSNSQGNLIAIAAGDTNWTFVADYYPQNVIGSTEITYCLHPLNGVLNGVCHSVTFELLAAQELAGCTYDNATNYLPEALQDDGSCVFPGCMDPTALNYSTHFNSADGSCMYGNDDSICPADVTGDGAVNVNDLLVLLGSFGAPCD